MMYIHLVFFSIFENAMNKFFGIVIMIRFKNFNDGHFFPGIFVF